MEKELNIAAILKDKSENTKLYSPVFGVVYFKSVSEYNDKSIDIAHHGEEFSFRKDGKIYKNGEILLFPSPFMRSWEKFAWKKGDVLTDNVSTICMFDSWANDDYTEFNAKYTFHLITLSNKESEVCKTNEFVPVVKDKDKQSYLATAETYFNVNLTKGPMWIEKPQFKDGDILVVNERNRMPKGIFIFDEKSQPADLSTQISISAYAFYDTGNSIVTINDGVYVDGRKLQLATDSEKQLLFDALAKENKAWNAEKKQIEDLPKKCEFKPKDWCLIQVERKDVWYLAQYASKFEDRYYFVGGMNILITKELIVLPYNDETRYLLGTTDDWKGGEYEQG